MNTAITAIVAIAGISVLLITMSSAYTEKMDQTQLPYADISFANQQITNFPGNSETALLQVKLINTGKVTHEGYTITCYDSNSVQSNTVINQESIAGNSIDIAEIIIGNYNYNDKQFCEVDITIDSPTTSTRTGFFAYTK